MTAGSRRVEACSRVRLFERGIDPTLKRRLMALLLLIVSAILSGTFASRIAAEGR